MTTSTAAGPATGNLANAATITSTPADAPPERSRAQLLRLATVAFVLAAVVTTAFGLGYALGDDRPSGDRPAPPPAPAPAASDVIAGAGGADLCRMGRAC